MTTFQSRITDANGDPVQSIAMGERSAHLHTSTALSSHPRIGEPIAALRDAVATVGETLAERSPDLTHTGFTKLASEQVSRMIAATFKAVQDGIPGAVADVEKRRAPLFEPKFPDAQSPAVRVEQRQFARSLSLPNLMQAVREDPDLAGAIVEGGAAMSGLPADLFERLRRDMAINRAAEIFAGQRTYTTAPSADDPVGGKPDREAARADAEAFVQALDDETDLLATVPAFLGNTVTAVALMLDTNRHEAFAALSGA